MVPFPKWWGGGQKTVPQMIFVWARLHFAQISLRKYFRNINCYSVARAVVDRRQKSWKKRWRNLVSKKWLLKTIHLCCLINLNIWNNKIKIEFQRWKFSALALYNNSYQLFRFHKKKQIFLHCVKYALAVTSIKHPLAFKGQYFAIQSIHCSKLVYIVANRPLCSGHLPSSYFHSVHWMAA